MSTTTRAETAAGPTPRIFVSYRTDDTGEIVPQFVDELRSDLGSRLVYRDDKLRPGQLWAEALRDKVEQADGVLALIGREWAGPMDEQGKTRLDQDDDPVRDEVQTALDTATTIVPVLVDIDDIPPGGPEAMREGIFARNFVRTTSADLVDPLSDGYAAVLVGAWESLAQRVPDAVIIVAESAQASLATFLEDLQDADAATTRELTRLGAHTVAISRRSLRRKIRRKSIPDVFVLVDETSTERRVQALVRAVEEHPRLRTVTLVGSTAALLGAATGAASSAAVSTAPTATAAVGTWVPVAAVAAAGATATGVAVAAILPDADALALDFAGRQTLQASFAEDDRLYPLGAPDGVQVRLGDPVEVPAEEDTTNPGTGYVSRSVQVQLPGQDDVDLGEIVYPTALTPVGAESNQDSTFALASVSGEIALDDVDFAGADYCYEVEEPTHVVGGWQYLGEPGTVAVSLVATTEGLEVVDTSVHVTVTGQGERVLLEELPPDFDVSRCPAEQTITTTWSS